MGGAIAREDHRVVDAENVVQGNAKPDVVHNLVGVLLVDLYGEGERQALDSRHTSAGPVALGQASGVLQLGGVHFDDSFAPDSRALLRSVENELGTMRMTSLKMERTNILLCDSKGLGGRGTKSAFPRGSSGPWSERTCFALAATRKATLPPAQPKPLTLPRVASFPHAIATRSEVTTQPRSAAALGVERVNRTLPPGHNQS